MTSSGLVTFKEIQAALGICAPGASIRKKLHHFWVSYNGLTFRGLPLGKHGLRENPEIEVGHVRKMARYLGILECMKQQLGI